MGAKFNLPSSKQRGEERSLLLAWHFQGCRMVRAAWVPYYRLFGDNRVPHKWHEERRGTLASTVLDTGMGSSDTLGAMFSVDCQLDKNLSGITQETGLWDVCVGLF